MNNYEKIYWLTRLDGLNSLFVVMSILSIALILLISISSLASKDFDQYYDGHRLKERINTRLKFTSKIKYLTLTLIVGVLGVIFLPTQKEAILIFAGGKTMDFVQKDTSIRKIPEQTTLLISTFFQKQIEEMNKPEEKKKNGK